MAVSKTKMQAGVCNVIPLPVTGAKLEQKLDSVGKPIAAAVVKRSLAIPASFVIEPQPTRELLEKVVECLGVM